ncbi:Sestrin-1 [Lunasporangiospora selenospora]|uniref:Sestrin-1 n=1 Tax=Lunasporangiospora selenospora TaxID=979761 RepID=A0A9P6FXP0_9FUNG|nr:Sestrin-1 [Lunasporangiospora selenospora]
MAASQYNCQYMVSMMKLDYLNSGGDPTWLNGLQYTTQKIRNLAKLNGLMAHQPWLLKPRHINELVSRDSNHNPHNVWTISELAQVMVILSTIHSISIFVAACGIVPEIDMVGGTFVDFTKLQSKQYGGSASIAASMMSPFSMLPSPNSDADATEVPQSSPSLGSSPDLTKPDCDFACDSLRSPFLYSVTLPPLHASKRTYDETTSKAHTAELIRRLLLERDVCVADGDDFDVDHTAEDDPCGLGLPHGYEEIQDTFPAPEPRIISPSLSTSLSDAIAAATQEQQRTQEKKFRPVQEDMGRFLDMSCQIEPALFDCRSIQYSVFRVDEFRWEDDGAALLSKCLPELSESLQDEFAETLNFTDLSLFDENEDQHEGGVDTFAFRQAIWYYTLRLFGLVYQDYNYKNMSKFLNMTMAVYVRKACHCITMASEPPQPSLDGNDGSGPQLYLSDINKIDRNDFENMGFELRQEERCHINVIVMEACKQAKLLYALRAVDRWERRAAGEIEEDEGEDERF